MSRRSNSIARAFLLTPLLLALCAAAMPALAETEQASEDEAERLSAKAARYFCSYKPSYFILGAYEKHRTHPTTKFQFSFQMMLLDLTGKDDEVADSCATPTTRHKLHLGYTQKSIWSLYAESAPFEENNYNPEILYGYHLEKLGIGWTTFGIEHESNGEGGGDSRSWNRLYGRARWNVAFDEGFHFLPERADDHDHWYAALDLKLWWAFDKDDEQVNLNKYIGYGKLRAELQSPEYCWGAAAFDVEVTKGGDPTQWDHASVQLGASWRQPTFTGRVKFVPFFYVQYFEGYGETLIRANEHTRAFRAGMRFIL